MTEPDTPDSDPIGYRMIKPCNGCGLEKATRVDCGYCRECIEQGGEAVVGSEPEVYECGLCGGLQPAGWGSHDCPGGHYMHRKNGLLIMECRYSRGKVDARAFPPNGQETVAAHPNVTAQAHYTVSDIEPIDVIEAWGLSFHLGNVVKYIARHKGKGGRTDLIKALSYLHREIHGEWPGE